MTHPVRSDYINELIRLEEDPEYHRIQGDLFHEHFEVSALTHTTRQLREIVDATVREIVQKSGVPPSRQIRWLTRLDSYPIGFCNDITHSVEALLKWGKRESLSPNSSVFSSTMVDQIMGVEAVKKIIEDQPSLPHQISKFQKAGWVFGSVWWIMPNEACFQWFILAGNHVVNVANDTLNRDTFPIDIAPLRPQTYRSIRDYSDYIKIAEKYWWWSVFRNTLFPQLAALYPIISLDERWFLRFPRPEILTKKSLATWFKLAQNIWNSDELNSPPGELESEFRNMGLVFPKNMADTFEKWREVTMESDSRTDIHCENIEFHRALYMVKKAEYEWQENFDRSRGNEALGILKN